jgi:hypothetical protein
MMILSQLPANGIEKVEWISSPSARYDSEGKAGMINITTVRGTTDGLYLQVNSRLGFPSIENYDNATNPKRYGADFNLNYLKGKWDLSLGQVISEMIFQAEGWGMFYGARRHHDLFSIRRGTEYGRGELLRKVYPWLQS